MKKINFTTEHLANLKTLATEFLFQGVTFKGQLSTPVSVYDLIHNTTLNSLKNMFVSLEANIKQKEASTDRWSADDSTQKGIQLLKDKSEFIDLLIGYKRSLIEAENIATKKAQLQEEIERLEKSTMTPAEQIAAMKAELEALG